MEDKLRGDCGEGERLRVKLRGHDTRLRQHYGALEHVGRGHIDIEAYIHTYIQTYIHTYTPSRGCGLVRNQEGNRRGAPSEGGGASCGREGWGPSADLGA